MESFEREKGREIRKRRARDEDNSKQNLKRDEMKDGGNPNFIKGRSCKGCLFYSSAFRSQSRHPLCLGITRSLPQVPRKYIVGEEDGRRFTELKYGCVGYSLYPENKGQKDEQVRRSELPGCLGVEALVGKEVKDADTVPAHAHQTEDNHGLPQPWTQKPAQSVGDEFLKKFTRNAGVVATGVAKNVRKVGNHLKESIDGILDPYRRPK